MRVRLLIKNLLFPGIDLNIRQRGKVLKKYLSTNGYCKTLDAGCGNGYFSIMAYEQGSRVSGVSIDEEAIRRCIAFRDFKKIPADRLRFQVLNLYGLGKLDEMYDQIICLETLEHIWDDEKVLRLLHQRLVGGGKLFLGVPNLNCRDFYGEKVSEVEDGGHVRKGYSYEPLETMLQKIGFDVVARDGYGGGWSRRAIALHRRVHDWVVTLGFNETSLVAESVNFATFLLLYPLTHLDVLDKGEPISIFIVGVKRQR